MEDFDVDVVAKKSVKGFFALSSRTFLVKVLLIITNFVLTAKLEPSVFGVYVVSSSIVTFLVYFQDIGLAASLIQKKEAITKEELRTTFSIQQLIVLCLIIPALLFSPQIASFYHLQTSGLYLLISLLLSFFISSLKTIPTVILERNLNFNKLVIPDIVENVTYALCLIIFVLLGFNVWAFTIAIFIRSISGLIVIYKIQPWSIGISFDFGIFKKLVSFGLPFQTNSILALVKDNLIMLYVARVLPLSLVGQIGFAQKLSFLPSNLIMDNIIRITFPSYSRLQHDRAMLKNVIEKSLFLIAILIFPIIVSFIMLSKPFILYIPLSKYRQWQGALTSITFFSLNILIASVTVPITNFLNAIGKVKITLYLMIFATALTWIFTPIFIRIYGYNGFSFTTLLVAASLLLIVPIAKREVSFSFFKPIVRPFLGAVVMFAYLFLTLNFINSFLLFIIEAVFGLVVYAFAMLFLARAEIKEIVSYLKSIRK